LEYLFRAKGKQNGGSMKKLTFFLVAGIILGTLGACSGAGTKADLAHKFLGKRGIASGEDRYSFQYSLNDGPMTDMDVYVYEVGQDYLITPEHRRGKAIAKYKYVTTEQTKNLISQHNMATRTVASLEEAIQEAMKWYITDFKLQESTAGAETEA
jgi:hypothetical protein